MYYIGFGILLILTFGFAWLEPKFDIKSRKVLYILLVLGYIFFIGLRPIEIKDTQNYIDIYEHISVHNFYLPNFFGKIYGVEYGFIYLIQIVKCLFGNNYRVLFLIVASFNYIVSMYGIRLIIEGIIKKEMTEYEKREIICQKKGIGFLLFNSYIGFLYSGISMRAGITFALSYCAIGYFIKKKYWKCCLSLIVAFLFQRTVAIIVIALICYNKLPVFSRKIYFIIWGVLGGMLIGQIGGYCINGVVAFINILIEKFHVGGYSGYLQNFDVAVGKIDIWLWFMAGIFLLYRVRLKTYYKLINVYLTGIVIIIFIYPIRAASRLYDYFIIFFVPVLMLEYFFGTNGKLREKLKKDVILLGVSVINMTIMLRLAFL